MFNLASNFFLAKNWLPKVSSNLKRHRDDRLLEDLCCYFEQKTFLASQRKCLSVRRLFLLFEKLNSIHTGFKVNLFPFHISMLLATSLTKVLGVIQP